MTFREAAAVDPAVPTLGRYVMHCHNLVREDHDVLNQFRVARTDGSTPDCASPVPTPSGHVRHRLAAHHQRAAGSDGTACRCSGSFAGACVEALMKPCT